MRWLAMAAQGLAGRTAARALAQGAWAEALLVAGGAGRVSTPQQGQAVVRRALSGGIPGVSAGAIRPIPMASGLTMWRGMASERGGTDDDAMHDDFKPVFRAGSGVEDAASVITRDVAEHKVFVYMKGVPDMPQCGFSNMVCRVLDAYGIRYGSRNVLEDPEIRQGIKDFTEWPTIPQVFMDGEFVGGSDILMEMHQNGELKTWVEENLPDDE